MKSDPKHDAQPNWTSTSQTKTFDAAFTGPPVYFLLAALKSTGKSNSAELGEYLRQVLEFPIGKNNLNNIVSRMIKWGLVAHVDGGGRKGSPRIYQLTKNGNAELVNSAKSFKYLHELGVHACNEGKNHPLAKSPISKKAEKRRNARNSKEAVEASKNKREYESV